MDVDSRHLIDAQFDRAVEIVQGLPKTGPIQTGYEEKLNMYSLYKQATVGNVQGSRPNVWDMLGRAKWDAWAKHKDLDSYEAKWLYVDALLKVLRKYSDKTVARDFVRELESYAGDPSNLVMSGMSARSPGSSSSGSSAADEMPSASLHRLAQDAELHPLASHAPNAADSLESETDESTDDDDDDEAADTVPPAIKSPHAPQLVRPQSSLSSRPYRTPMTGPVYISSPPPLAVPHTQPHPGFQTQSAFAESEPSIPSSAYPPTSVVVYTDPPTARPASASAHGYGSRAGFRPPSQPQPPYRQYSLQSGGGGGGGGGGAGGPARPASLPLLERAVESVQAHLAAMTERLETLEALLHHSTSSLSPSGMRSPGPAEPAVRWDVDDMGMWALVLRPLARALRVLRLLAAFVASAEHRSPTAAVVRRLALDLSFVLCVLAVCRFGWRRSGVRRREVSAALRGLWRAVVGQQVPRAMVERGV